MYEMFGTQGITVKDTISTASTFSTSVQDESVCVAQPIRALYEENDLASGADGSVDTLKQSEIVFEITSSEALQQAANRRVGACAFCGAYYAVESMSDSRKMTARLVDACATCFERMGLSTAGYVQTAQENPTPRRLNSNNNNAEVGGHFESRATLIGRDSEPGHYSASMAGELEASNDLFGADVAHKYGLAPTIGRAEASNADQWWICPELLIQRGGVKYASSSERLATSDANLPTWNRTVGGAPSEQTARLQSAKSETCKWTRSELCVPNSSVSSSSTTHQAAACERHWPEPITTICHTCSLLMCEQCVLRNDGCEHVYSDSQPLGAAIELLAIVNKEAKSKLAELRRMIIGLQQISTTLVMHARKTQARINDQASALTMAVKERRAELQQTLTTAYQARNASISSITQRIQSLKQRIMQLSDWGDHLHAAAINACDANSLIQVIQQQRMVSDKLSALRREQTALTNQFVSLVATCMSTHDDSLSADPSTARGIFGFHEMEFFVQDSAVQSDVAHLLDSLHGTTPSRLPFVSTASFNDQFDFNTNQSQSNHCGTTALASTSDCFNQFALNNSSLTPTSNYNYYPFSSTAQSSVAKFGMPSTLQTLAARCGIPVLNLGKLDAQENNSHSGLLKATSPLMRANDIDRMNDMPPGSPDSPDCSSTPLLSSGYAAATEFSQNDYLISSPRNADSSTDTALPRELAHLNTAVSRTECRQWSLSDSQTSGSQEASSAQELMDVVAQQVDMLAVPPEHRWMYLNAPSNDTLLQMRNTLARTRISYHVKFGEFGIMNGQFTEPSGVAVSPNNEIIVADTNNHRIQAFQSDGRFKFQFGECGKRDSQLLYPNRVAVNPQNGDIIVTERSPTHQIQIYSHLGQFKRKFGASVLQHPRGVTIDNQGRILVVECKVMRVVIFDQSGKVLRKLSLSKYLEFPNGIAVNNEQKIFISDNRAHSVKMFDYSGRYLRQIGGEGITNYPIGVAVSPAGEILVADNHNNFNLTIFSNNYEVIAALESKARHVQCFDIALLGNDSVVLASKDYHLYIYRYKD